MDASLLNDLFLETPDSPASGGLHVLSAHQLKTWQKCRKKFYYDSVKKLRWPTDPSNFRLGRSVHKLLEYQALGLPYEHLVQAADADVQACWQQLMAHPIPQLPIVASEWGFTVPIHNENRVAVWLVGRVDRIARQQTEKGDRILVIDWKTGTAIPRDPENDWQTVLYCYAVVEAARDLFDEKGLPDFSPEAVEFLYVGVKEAVQVVRIPYSTEKHAAARARLQQTAAEIQAETVYALPARCPDRYCPYRPICGIEEREAGSGEI